MTFNKNLFIYFFFPRFEGNKFDGKKNSINTYFLNRFWIFALGWGFLEAISYKWICPPKKSSPGNSENDSQNCFIQTYLNRR